MNRSDAQLSSAEPPRAPGEPVQIDAALARVIALLELVCQEETVLRRLSACTHDLGAIRRARQTLLGVTDAELAEATAASSPLSSLDATSGVGGSDADAVVL